MASTLAALFPAGTVALIATGAAAVFGGWPFALITFPLLLAVWWAKYDWQAVLFAATPGMIWLFIFVVSGDRRCYFPYALQYAMVLAALPQEKAFGGRFVGFALVTALFLLIRSAQDASLKVLVVELLVAAAVGLVTVALHGAMPRPLLQRFVFGALASVMAFCGLAF